MKKYCLIFMLLASTQLAQSQGVDRKIANQTNAWLMYFGNHKIAEKWGLHLEAQWRGSEVLAEKQQWLARLGLQYFLSKNASLTAGYCFVQTYPYGEQPVKSDFPENRFFEQLQLKNQLKKFEWMARFRLEQRLVNVPVAANGGFEAGDAVYTNRFRLLNRFSIPFKGQSIADRSFYLSFYDEIFANFGRNVGLNLFDQNRAYVALGYRFPKIGRLELGYLNQILVKSDGLHIEENHTLQLGLSSSIDFFHKKS